MPPSAAQKALGDHWRCLEPYLPGVRLTPWVCRRLAPVKWGLKTRTQRLNALIWMQAVGLDINCNTFCQGILN